MFIKNVTFVMPCNIRLMYYYVFNMKKYKYYTCGKKKIKCPYVFIDLHSFDLKMFKTKEEALKYEFEKYYNK